MQRISTDYFRYSCFTPDIVVPWTAELGNTLFWNTHGKRWPSFETAAIYASPFSVSAMTFGPA